MTALSTHHLGHCDLGAAIVGGSLMRVAKIGRRLAIARHDPKNRRPSTRSSEGDLIRYVLGDTRKALIPCDWTDPEDYVHQILSLNWRTHGRGPAFGRGDGAARSGARPDARDGKRPAQTGREAVTSLVPSDFLSGSGIWRPGSPPYFGVCVVMERKTPLSDPELMDSGGLSYRGKSSV